MRRDHDTHDLITRLAGCEIRGDVLFHGELVALIAAERKHGAGAVLIEGHESDENKSATARDTAELHDDHETVCTLGDAAAIPRSCDEDAAATGAAGEQNEAEKQNQEPFHDSNPANGD